MASPKFVVNEGGGSRGKEGARWGSSDGKVKYRFFISGNGDIKSHMWLGSVPLHSLGHSTFSWPFCQWN